LFTTGDLFAEITRPRKRLKNYDALAKMARQLKREKKKTESGGGGEEREKETERRARRDCDLLSRIAKRLISAICKHQL
jgi:HEPN domain-containing protein